MEESEGDKMIDRLNLIRAVAQRLADEGVLEETDPILVELDFEDE